MKEMHAISLVALIYSVILALVALIFFNDYTVWAILGSATALFNHSLMIRVLKGKYSAQKHIFHLFQRYTFYFIIIIYTWLTTKDAGENVMMYSMIFLILGISMLKIAIYTLHIPPIRKKWIKEDENDV